MSAEAACCGALGYHCQAWSGSDASSQKPPTAPGFSGLTAVTNRMKTLLLHAPGDSPCDTPWMGVPALVARLKQAGYQETHQRDLDLELFYHSLKPETLSRIAGIIRNNRTTENGASRNGTGRAVKVGLAKRLFVRVLGMPLLRLLARWELRDREFFERFRNSTPVGECFPEEGLLRYRKALNGILKLMGTFYYPYLAYPKFFSRREERNFYRVHLRLGNYFYDSMNLGEQALVDFYRTELLGQIEAEGYDLIGISVSVSRQYEPALVLARTLREHGVQAKLVLGGSYISNTYDSDWLEDDVVRHVDYVVRYEGEEALPALLECREEGRPVDDVPNLVFFRDDERVENRRDFLREITSLPTPDFDDLPLERYLDRPVRLPIGGNRGCYWAKCTFCAHFWALGTGRLRLRPAQKLFGDMQTLEERHGVNTFFMTDESIDPEEVRRLADLILEGGTHWNWSGMARFEECMDRAYLERLQSAGCYCLMFGLESIVQRVQEIIKKGTDVETAWKILADCHAIGMKVHLFIILGTPGETEEEMRANVDFLRENTDLYQTVQIATFELSPGSPMHRRPEEFGIRDIRTVSRGLRLAYSEVDFDTTEGLSRAEVKRWCKVVENDEVLFPKDIWSGYGFRIYQPERLDPPQPSTGGGAGGGAAADKAD